MRISIAGPFSPANAMRLALVTVVSVTLLGCPDHGTETAGSPGSESDSGEVVATVRGEPILLGEVEQVARDRLQQIDRERFEVLRLALNDLVNERLIAEEAQARGLTPREFLVQEVAEKVPEPNDEEVRAAYDEVRSRVGDRTFDELKAQIRQGFLNQRRKERQVEVIRRLREEAELEILLEPPRSFVPVEPDENIRGGQNATVTVVGYGNFQSSPYRQMHPVIARLLDEYGDRLRYVFRDFPISEQTRSVAASLAARCARDQGRFWEYHDNLLTVPGDLGDEDLVQRADEMGMIVEAFRICLDSRSHADAVRRTFETGRTLGVTGLPTYFVNGRMIVGVQAYEDFRDVVERELEQAGTAD